MDFNCSMYSSLAATKTDIFKLLLIRLNLKTFLKKNINE